MNNLERELYLSYKFFIDSYSRNPLSYGLVPDTFPTYKSNLCSIAGTGYLFTALVIGCEFNYIDKLEAEAISLKAINSIYNLKTYHGWYYHFYDSNSGENLELSEISNVDSALLFAGCLVAGNYFGGEIKNTAISMINRANFKYFLQIYGEWFSMGCDYKYNFIGHWDRYAEQLLLYVLGCANENIDHKVDSEPFYKFIRDYKSYKDGENFICSWVGSIFTYQFSHAYIDFRNKKDKDGVDWFKNSVIASKSAYEFAKDSEGQYKSFHRLSWGLTACANIKGYSGRYGNPPTGIGRVYIDGTVAPCGAIGSIVFTPKESIEALDYFYSVEKLVGEYGLFDSYNEDQNYYCDHYISIDKGITMAMIANYLKETVWKYFTNCDFIQKALKELEIKED